MGLFSNLVGGAGAYPQNEAEAVLGILLAVIAGDGAISDEEASSFNFLSNHTKALGPVPASVFSGHVDTCLSILRRDGAAGALIEKCAAKVTQEKRGPLFINACDLVLRDGRVEPEEEQMLEALQRSLGIDDTMAQNVVSMILMKYSL